MQQDNADKTHHIMSILESVIDPETGINIVDMGLIYGVSHDGDDLSIRMTMTSAACPVGDMLIEDVEQSLRKAFPECAKITVDLIFNPPWDPTMMSQSARDQFGW